MRIGRVPSVDSVAAATVELNPAFQSRVSGYIFDLVAAATVESDQQIQPPLRRLKPKSTDKKWVITNSANIHRLPIGIPRVWIFTHWVKPQQCTADCRGLLKSLQIGLLQRLQQTGQSAVHP
jgi:hypothetical protein